MQGKPTLKRRGKKAYWYAAQRIGTRMRFTYPGEDNDETRMRIERIEELRATAKERQAERSRLVRLLRAEGMTPHAGFESRASAAAHCTDDPKPGKLAIQILRAGH